MIELTSQAAQRGLMPTTVLPMAVTSEVVFLASGRLDRNQHQELTSSRHSFTHHPHQCESLAALRECGWDQYSVAQRMSWAAGVQTTRVEDAAYLGLFDMSHAPQCCIGCEGTEAFSRLQQEILKQHEDQSNFASGPFLRERIRILSCLV